LSPSIVVGSFPSIGRRFFIASLMLLRKRIWHSTWVPISSTSFMSWAHNLKKNLQIVTNFKKFYLFKFFLKTKFPRPFYKSGVGKKKQPRVGRRCWLAIVILLSIG
jgi:hypothetical protein